MLKYLYELLTDPAHIVIVVDFVISRFLELRLTFFDFPQLMMYILLFKVLFEVNLNLFMCMRVKRMEKAWNRSQISKISNGSRKTWKKTRVSDLQVGDMILLRNETISPVDMLVLCTSELMHSEMILFNNERKITGRNKISVKNAIRNIVEDNVTQSSIQELTSPVFLEQFCKKMVGVVEYDCPDVLSSEITGNFKLKNDPKVSRFGNNNILYCGSKLYSEAMIGLVLFTGKHTKIFKQNLLNQSFWGSSSIKKKFLLQLKRPVFFLHIGWAFITTICVSLFLFSSPSSLELSSIIESTSTAETYINIVLSSLLMSSIAIPVLLFFVIDVANVLLCVSLECSESSLLPSKRTWCLCRTKKVKDNSSTSTDDRTDYRSSIAASQDIRSAREESIGLMNQSNLREFDLIDNELGTFERRTLLATSSSYSKSKPRTLKILNLDLLMNLSSADHIVFDKTDTLTQGDMRVGRIASVRRDYALELTEEEFDKMLEDSRRNYAKYMMSDSDEDVENEDDDSDYSEKSQETIRELECDYISSLMDENSEEKEVDVLIQRTVDRGDTLGQKNKSLFNSNSKGSKLAKEMFKESIRKESMPSASVLDIKRVEVSGVERQSELKNLTVQPTSVLVDIERKLSIKFNKNYSESRLISDAISQREDLQDLMAYLMLFLDVAKTTKTSKSEMICIAQDDKAISQMLRRFGYHLDRIDTLKLSKNRSKSKSGPQYGFTEYDVKIESVYNLYSVFTVKGVNQYTNVRKRVSIAVVDKQRGMNSYFLIVKGDETVMKECLNLDKKERNQFKQLMAHYRNSGYKTIVIGCRAMSNDEMKSYKSAMEKISKSKRDQIDEYEKIAMIYEKNLRFVGCVGVVDIIRDDVKPLIGKLKDAKMDMSILSGDNLVSCLNIVKELEFADTNFTDTTDFFSLVATNERRLMIQIKRIIDDIYQALKHHNIESKKMFWKSDKSKRTSTIDKTETNDTFLELSRTATQLKEDEKNDGILGLTKSDKLKRSLLINGQTIILVKSSSDATLVNYMKIILIFCDRIIGYSMDSDHKVFVVKLLQSLDKIVVAIGDGFNDIGMLTSSNSGIQILNKNVPLIIADAAISSFKDYTELHFNVSFRLVKNVCMACFVYVRIVSCYIAICLAAFRSTDNTMLFFSSVESAIVFIVALVDCLLLIVFDESVDARLTEKFPIMSREAMFLRREFVGGMSIAILLGIIEAVFIFVIMYFYLAQDYNKEGLPPSIEFNSLVVMLVIIINHKIRMMMHFNNRFSLRGAVVNIGTPAIAVAILMYYTFVKVDDVLVPFALSEILESKLSISAFFIMIVFSSYISNMVSMMGRVAHFNQFYKQAFDMKHHSKNKEPKVLTKNLQRAFEKWVEYYSSNTISELINKVKAVSTPGMIETLVNKIVLIDSTSHRLGVSNTFNRIRDGGEYNRFKKYYLSSSRRLSQSVLIIIIVLLVAEWGVTVATYGFENYQLNTGIPMMAVVFLVPLMASLIKGHTYVLDYSLNISFIISFVTLLALAILNPPRAPVVAVRVINRAIYCPLPLTFIFVCVLGTMIEIVRSVNQYLRDSSSYENKLTVAMNANAIVFSLVYLMLRILLKKKYDQLVKYDYLSKAKLQNEINESNEMLSLLMPWFVIERLSNFEISRNFVADDAGEIAILFCDICAFDDVIKEYQGKVIDLLDEVFRFFDNACKQRGVQKIETVGKTYMACAGLKLVEKNLPIALRSKNPCIRVLEAAIDMREFVSTFVYSSGKNLQIKIGIHYGTCIFGVLGYHKPQFSLIGDTINTTSRHCTTGDPDNIILSESAWNEVKSDKRFQAEVKSVEMKGKGAVSTYIIHREEIKKPRRRNERQSGTVINTQKLKIDLKGGNQSRLHAHMDNLEVESKVVYAHHRPIILNPTN